MYQTKSNLSTKANLLDMNDTKYVYFHNRLKTLQFKHTFTYLKAYARTHHLLRPTAYHSEPLKWTCFVTNDVENGIESIHLLLPPSPSICSCLRFGAFCATFKTKILFCSELLSDLCALANVVKMA